MTAPFHDDDPLGPARGCVLGLLFGGLLWILAICAYIAWVLHA